jgi:hypothetical protein
LQTFPDGGSEAGALMIPYRYLSAVLINLLVPWLAYRLTLPHWGYAGALAASAVPLVAWMVWDYARLRHFDALSAIVLAGLLLSLGCMPLGVGEHGRALQEPTISGMIGAVFLLSLPLRRPLVFYLARSTMARESRSGAADFERHWRERPELALSIRHMTLVWGVGLVAENIVRYWIVSSWSDSEHAVLVSKLLKYGVYGALTLWTIWYRRYIRRSADVTNAA